MGMMSMCPACGSDWCVGAECVRREERRHIKLAYLEAFATARFDTASVDTPAELAEEFWRDSAAAKRLEPEER